MLKQRTEVDLSPQYSKKIPCSIGSFRKQKRRKLLRRQATQQAQSDAGYFFGKEA
jgi:hypothetical protein